MVGGEFVVFPVLECGDEGLFVEVECLDGFGGCVLLGEVHGCDDGGEVGRCGLVGCSAVDVCDTEP